MYLQQNTIIQQNKLQLMSETGLNVQPIREQNERAEEGKETIQLQNKKQENQKPYEYDKDKDSEEEQEEDDEPDYKIDKLLPKQNQKQKLIQQNIKLKTQIYELASQLDEILLKDKINKKKKYGITIDQQDQTVRQKKLQLKKQQVEIVQVKNKIFVVKRELDSVYNNQVIQQKEDHLKNMKLNLKQMQDEKQGLLKIQKGQTKALKTLKNEKQYKDKIDKTHKEVIRVKEQTKLLMQKALQAQKNEIKNHDAYCFQKQKARQLQTKLALNKEKGSVKEKQKTKKSSPQMTISNQVISGLEEEVRKLQIERKKGEKVWLDKIRHIDGELQLKRIEEDKKLLIIRQKEKETKLNEIRIKQLRKVVKQNIISENTKKTEDVDMRKYRYQRNIKQMEK